MISNVANFYEAERELIQFKEALIKYKDSDDICTLYYMIMNDSPDINFQTMKFLTKASRIIMQGVLGEYD